MKFTIDTTNKTITLEDNITFTELINELGRILPDYREYTLIPKIITTYPYYPSYPAAPYNPGYPLITYTAKISEL